MPNKFDWWYNTADRLRDEAKAGSASINLANFKNDVGYGPGWALETVDRTQHANNSGLLTVTFDQAYLTPGSNQTTQGLPAWSDGPELGLRNDDVAVYTDRMMLRKSGLWVSGFCVQFASPPTGPYQVTGWYTSDGLQWGGKFFGAGWQNVGDTQVFVNNLSYSDGAWALLLNVVFSDPADYDLDVTYAVLAVYPLITS